MGVSTIIVKIKQKSFLNKLSIIFAGSLSSQVVIVASLPLIANIFSPEQIGVYAIMLLITVAIGSISCLGYDISIFLPKKKNEVLYILYGIFFLLPFLSVIIPFSLYTSINNIEELKGFEYIKLNIYIIWFGGAIEALNLMISSFSLRLNEFEIVAKSKFVGAISIISFQVILYLFLQNNSGLLIVGYVGGKFIELIYLLIKTRGVGLIVDGYRDVSYKNILKVLRKYKNFFKFETPNRLFFNITNILPSVIIGMAYGNSFAGLYFMSQRILNLPLQIFGPSLKRTLTQHISERIRSKKSIKPQIIKYSISLLIFSLFIYLFIYLFTEDAVKLLFKQEWEGVVGIVLLLLPLFLLKFIVTSVAVILPVMQLQYISMIWKFFLMLATMISLTFGVLINDFEKTLLYLVVSNSIVFVLVGLVCFYQISSYEKKIYKYVD
jgi:O-antigen/teichoic acid export membrane protein